jgi:hypothetical protein
MDLEDIARGSALLARFETGGFTALVNDELRNLSAYLGREAMETVRAGALLLSQILGFVDGFFREQDEYGGVQLDFINRLDNLAQKYFTSAATADGSESTRLAREQNRNSTAIPDHTGEAGDRTLLVNTNTLGIVHLLPIMPRQFHTPDKPIARKDGNSAESPATSHASRKSACVLNSPSVITTGPRDPLAVSDTCRERNTACCRDREATNISRLP